MALSAAVQMSGLADRIGMAQTTQVIQTKTLDYFFSLRMLHNVAFQPIVDLASGDLHEYECLFRPNMPMLPQSIGSIVQAAIDTDRSIELDVFLISRILERAGELDKRRRADGGTPLRVAVNVTPASLLDPRFEAARSPRWFVRPDSIRARSRSSAPSSRPSPTSCASRKRSRPSDEPASDSPWTMPAPATPASP